MNLDGCRTCRSNCLRRSTCLDETFQSPEVKTERSILNFKDPKFPSNTRRIAFEVTTLWRYTIQSVYYYVNNEQYPFSRFDTIPACDRRTDGHRPTAYTSPVTASRDKKKFDLILIVIVTGIDCGFFRFEVVDEQSQNGAYFIGLVELRHAVSRSVRHVHRHLVGAERERAERQDAVVEAERQQRLTVHARHARPRVALHQHHPPV